MEKPSQVVYISRNKPANDFFFYKATRLKVLCKVLIYTVLCVLLMYVALNVHGNEERSLSEDWNEYSLTLGERDRDDESSQFKLWDQVNPKPLADSITAVDDQSDGQFEDTTIRLTPRRNSASESAIPENQFASAISDNGVH